MTNEEIEARAKATRIVPVLTIEKASLAVPLAKALIAGGLDVLEVTLRTEEALDAIGAIKQSGLNCVIGAGTIVSERDVAAAQKVGAQFLVTPGTPAALLPALLNYNGVVIPGAGTATEAMALYQAGFDLLKFFPAEASGGVKFLKGVGGPIPGVRFMPTGGINLANMADYLRLDNVLAIGGTWIAPASDIDGENWDIIEVRAREAYRLAEKT